MIFAVSCFARFGLFCCFVRLVAGILFCGFVLVVAELISGFCTLRGWGKFAVLCFAWLVFRSLFCAPLNTAPMEPHQSLQRKMEWCHTEP